MAVRAVIEGVRRLRGSTAASPVGEIVAWPRRAALVLTGVMLTIAVCALLIAGIALTVPDAGRASLAEYGEDTAAAVCEANASRVGAETAGEPGRMQIRATGDSALEAAVARADAVLQGCPGYDLVSFCAGSECDAAFEMTLEYAP